MHPARADRVVRPNILNQQCGKRSQKRADEGIGPYRFYTKDREVQGMGATTDILEILNQINHKTTIRELLDKVVDAGKYESMKRMGPDAIQIFVDRHNEKY